MATIRTTTPGETAKPPQHNIFSRDIGPFGSINDVRAELDDMCRKMHEFCTDEPDEVAEAVSAYTARLVELKLQIVRLETTNQALKTLRTQEVDPLLREMQEQWGIASRRHTMREFDFKAAMGQPS